LGVLFELFHGLHLFVCVVSPESVGVGEEGEAHFVGIEPLDEEVEEGFYFAAYLDIESQLHFNYKILRSFICLNNFGLIN